MFSRPRHTLRWGQGVVQSIWHHSHSIDGIISTYIVPPSYEVFYPHQSKTKAEIRCYLHDEGLNLGKPPVCDPLGYFRSRAPPYRDYRQFSVPSIGAPGTDLANWRINLDGINTSIQRFSSKSEIHFRLPKFCRQSGGAARRQHASRHRQTSPSQQLRAPLQQP